MCRERNAWTSGKNSISVKHISMPAHHTRCDGSQFSSVQFSHSVMSDSLWTHELQHARPPCPTQTPRVYSNFVHQVGHAIQPSHPLSLPSSPAPKPYEHQGLFQWVNTSHKVTKVLELSFSISPSNELPGLMSFRMTSLNLLQSKGLSRAFSNTTVQKH